MRANSGVARKENRYAKVYDCILRRKPAQFERRGVGLRWRSGKCGLKVLVIRSSTRAHPLAVSKIVTSTSVEDDHNPNAMKGFCRGESGHH